MTLRLITEEQIIASYQQNVSKDNTAFHASGKINTYIYIYVTRNISTVHYYKTRTFKQAVADWISKPTIAEQSTKRRI